MTCPACSTSHALGAPCPPVSETERRIAERRLGERRAKLEAWRPVAELPEIPDYTEGVAVGIRDYLDRRWEARERALPSASMLSVAERERVSRTYHEAPEPPSALRLWLLAHWDYVSVVVAYLFGLVVGVVLAELWRIL